MDPTDWDSSPRHKMWLWIIHQSFQHNKDKVGQIFYGTCFINYHYYLTISPDSKQMFFESKISNEYLL